MNYSMIRNELVRIFHHRILLRFDQLKKIFFERFQLIICNFDIFKRSLIKNLFELFEHFL